MRAKIKWRDDEDGHLVSCEEEFRHTLAEAEQDAARMPLIAEVILDDGDCLAIGLGREVSVLSYVGASKMPPYFSSQGSARVRDGEGVVFHYYGHWSEFPPSAAVPIAEAVEAVRYFCRHGKLSPLMNWAEV
ncbi:Imm1 family immunity protein [Actinoplanes solisilvae]|uniref:Imm1 family immunity protein n=1 Tax=Actinoplanes solisilvae TaxID=2486853 RepID=UPI0013E29AA0|nr:Imm1 family immunity protein [Actinoplanes solisilvae]